MDLSNQSAIVTGGASGLGHATARRLADAGAAVVVVDLPDREGETVRADAVAALGPRARFVTGDVTAEDTAREAVAAALEAGPLRVLVNCAGVATPGKLVGRDGPLSAEVLSRVLAINAVGTVSMMAQAAAAMKAQEPLGEDRGVIVNTASVAAYDGQIGQIAYSASKGAVVSLTLPAARELASSQIRVVTIAPGLMETPMMAGLPEAAREALSTKTPHPARLGRPEDYALLVEQIVSNPFLNGEVIRLDGAVRLEPR
ncbi:MULTISPECIES: SDR family NAD(P)-dependent oxidoreductase [Micrococcus]|uniref:SDR family NAD(P)-dependent oxidoreductase n=1 Tax=Micrococcus TaxID=1269 RepID=UPI00119B5055|nr:MULTISPECIES: SDR family NAD(P)-dependent oxidoreductase [Micrococcus]MBO1029329.1 SDR family NAD(P)-dependent oxidoreductase [Micrococcus luteus]MCT2254411.1 SDR family NAD(P)-dependent oxidoreductase [Micrococcus luteus]MCV7491467.1 SDR family NAD(P)-dependent oxidoreductase [Micrococcus luteus]MCV7515960.1 SDR family NAD(P)-dependent oxidoreductase [Micrococcus luteus]MCV7541145.1 SDR family NAD(P)-dependent oxidoreductase [Micrococcus luteus]